MHVAKTAIATLGDSHLLTGLQQFMQHLARLGVRNDGPHGHLEHDVVTLDAKHVRALAVFTTVGFESPGEPEIHKGVQAGVCHRIHVASAASIAAIRPPEFLVLFMPERCAAIAAIARSDIDHGFVHKLHDMLSRGFDRTLRPNKKPAQAGLLLEMFHKRLPHCTDFSIMQRPAPPPQTGVILTT